MAPLLVPTSHRRGETCSLNGLVEHYPLGASVRLS